MNLTQSESFERVSNLSSALFDINQAMKIVRIKLF